MKPVRSICLLLVLGLSLLVCTSGRAQVPGASSGTAPSIPQPPQPAPARTTMADIHDIKPLERIALVKTWLPYLLAGLTVLLLALAFWLWRRKRRPQVQQKTPPPLPPEVVALDALVQLAADQKSSIDGPTFYFRLSAILREYIDQRYALRASKMTTEEFVPRVTTLDLDRSLKQPLIELCQGADPVKFARAPVGELKMEADLRFVEDFVKRTMTHV